MRPPRSWVAGLLPPPLSLALAAVLVAGCSSSAGADPDAGTAAGTPMATTGVVCAKAATSAVPLPRGFPSNFPFPAKTKILAADDRGDAGIVITAVTDLPFPQALQAMNTALPAKGFKLGDGESEPDDAESDWTSSAYSGRWAIRELPGCEDDTSIQVVASPR